LNDSTILITQLIEITRSLKLECMKEEIMKEDMTTLSSILEKLRLQKEDHEFRWTAEGFTAGKGKTYQPEDLKIIKTYRFEGESDPSDSSILYLIEANDHLVGYSLDAYGLYSNHEGEEGYDNFIRRIPVQKPAQNELEQVSEEI
jgi:hypothetical protein